MSNATASVASATTVQELLASVLDSHRPASLLVISQNPPEAIRHWCAQHDCSLTELSDPDPAKPLSELGRFDLAVVADQLEYMNHQAAESLLGLLRNLHTSAMLALYQPNTAPGRLRWSRNDFLAMGMRQEGVFQAGSQSLLAYSYDLDEYNFIRQWNNPRYWANPENWGRYWW